MERMMKNHIRRLKGHSAIEIDMSNEDYQIFERIAIALERITKALESSQE